VKVKAKTPVKYKGKPYFAGQEFEITKKDYEAHKNMLEVVEEKKKSSKQGNDWELDELKAMAADKGLEGYDNMNKEELIGALKALEDDDNGGSTDHDNPPADTVTGQE